MEIRWNNVFGLLLLILGIYLLLKMRPFFSNAFEDINSAHYYHHGNPIHGLVILGIICITVVAVVKILSERRR
jgi:subtilase family serine protease